MQRRALVVDDEQDTCELIQRVLYAAGVDALTLTRTGQATGFLEEGKFDMVLFDLHMGSPDGIELSPEMRHLARLTVEESARFQEFLLQMISIE
ncbi:MAG: response regulator [Candidatus Acidiferrales bacterium]